MYGGNAFIPQGGREEGKMKKETKKEGGEGLGRADGVGFLYDDQDGSRAMVRVIGAGV